jgi:hypothetical protein
LQEVFHCFPFFYFECIPHVPALQQDFPTIGQLGAVSHFDIGELPFIAANDEKSFFAFAAEHFGQFAVVSSRLANFSKTSSHFSHLYSNIGIVQGRIQVLSGY